MTLSPDGHAMVRAEEDQPLRDGSRASSRRGTETDPGSGDEAGPYPQDGSTVSIPPGIELGLGFVGEVGLCPPDGSMASIPPGTRTRLGSGDVGGPYPQDDATASTPPGIEKDPGSEDEAGQFLRGAAMGSNQPGIPTEQDFRNPQAARLRPRAAMTPEAAGAPRRLLREDTRTRTLAATSGLEPRLMTPKDPGEWGASGHSAGEGSLERAASVGSSYFQDVAKAERVPPSEVWTVGKYTAEAASYGVRASVSEAALSGR